MNLRTIIIATLAIVSGVGTVVGVKKMQSGTLTAPADVETVDVVVAAIDLPMLKLLKAEDVTLKAWPKDLVPPGAITKVEDLEGKTIRQSKKMNQPIFQADIDSGRGIDVLIPDGQNLRLVTILTPSEASNVAGLVQPGDHIDINLILTNTSNDDSFSPTGGAHARVLLQNVVVVSVGQQVELTEDKDIPGPYQSVTLAVTPEQSLVLQLAGTKGTLTLALRKAGDSEIVDVSPFTLTELRELDSFSTQDEMKVVDDAAKSEPEIAETPFADTLKDIWREYSEASETAAAKKSEPQQRMVDVYRRIRTYRGTTSGEVLLRTQELQTVANAEPEPEAEGMNVGLPASVGASTP